MWQFMPRKGWSEIAAVTRDCYSVEGSVASTKPAVTLECRSFKREDLFPIVWRSCRSGSEPISNSQWRPGQTPTQADFVRSHRGRHVVPRRGGELPATIPRSLTPEEVPLHIVDALQEDLDPRHAPRFLVSGPRQ